MFSKREVTKFVVEKSEQDPIALTSLEEPTDYPASYNEATRAWEAKVTIDETGIYDYYAEYEVGKNSKTYSFTVLMNPDKFVKVENPTSALCKQNLVYNGETQDLVENIKPEGYTYKNHQQKDANTYQITATLNEKFRWSDSSTEEVTFDCVINPKELIVTPKAGQSKKYNAEEPDLTYDYTGNIDTETPLFEGKLERETGTDVGTYKITQGNLTLKDNNNFKASNYTLKFSETIVTFTIEQAETTLRYSPSSLSIEQGSSKTATITSNNEGTWNITSNDNSTATVSYDSGSSISKNVIVEGIAPGSTTLSITFTPLSNNYASQTESYSIKITTPPTGVAINVLKDKIGTGGLIGVTTNNTKTTTKGASNIREYRYSGAEVNNYVYFNCSDSKSEQNSSNCETWRIIGIFKDETNNEHMKIVRNSVLSSSMVWNSSGNQSWTSSSVKTYLNGSYLSSLSNNAQNMIESTKLYLGSLYITATNAPSTIGAYGSERNYEEYGTWPGKIALMYPSDYGFTASDSYWTTTMYRYSGAAMSWFNETATPAHEWLLSPSSVDTGTVACLNGYGSITFTYTNRDNVFRPSLYLKSTVQITGGVGTSSSPYQLSS